MNQETTVGVFLLSCTLTLGSATASAESIIDPSKRCVDQSITIGERIMWSLWRNTSKSAQELLCEKTQTIRAKYTEQDVQYFTRSMTDRDHRTQKFAVQTGDQAETSITSKTDGSGEFMIERYETQSFREEKGDSEVNLLDTVNGYKTVEPSQQ